MTFSQGWINRKSRRSKATQNYEKFFELLKDADPSIALVEATRKMMAELKIDWIIWREIDYSTPSSNATGII